MNIYKYNLLRETMFNIKLTKESLHYLMMKELISHVKLERCRSFLL